MPARGRPANAGWLQEATIRGHMLGKTMLPGDEELGKKDDDHRFAPARRSGWSIWNHSFRWRRKRTLLIVVVLLAVYMLLGGLGGRSRFSMGDAPSIYDEPTEPKGIPEGVYIPKGSSQYVFDGSIRFYRLRSSIRAAAGRTNGYDKDNRNVLFVASSLKSAATLLPVVCEMSHWSRNHVHMAFMGREDIPLADLLDINGIDKEKCSATWHDARPDYVEYSTDRRAERAVAGALSHLQTYLHPQAVIMDDSISEDIFFVRGIRNKAELLEIPLIEIPKDRIENFGWLTRLDAGSLRNWHSPTIDILIQVPSDSSNVLRLLNSIKDADYKGLRPPRLIFDVPTRLDQSVKQHLQDLKWPPYNAQQSPLEPSGLAIRRRIEKASAVHHLELFYPSSSNSHVLLLTPQAELSPFYFHYVLYTLLEYKYSTFGAADSRELMGISLQQPSLLLDEKSPLLLPTTDDMYSSRYQQLFPKTPSAPLLWQTPNSHATLYFGDKWAELHSFLTYRVAKHKPSLEKSSLSSYLPGWIEPMVEFMRARGYAVLYPAKSKDTFVTIHNDLALPPDEAIPPRYSSTTTSSSSAASHVPDDSKTFLDADSSSQPLRPPKHDESPTVPASKPIHLALPFDGDLPEIAHLPQLLYNGTLAPPATASSVAKEYADIFRSNVGGCTAVPKGMKKKVVTGEATDLFCFGDEDAEDWEPIEGYSGTEKLKVDVGDGNDEVLPTAGVVLPTKTVTAHKTQAKQTVVADEPDEF